MIDYNEYLEAAMSGSLTETINYSNYLAENIDKNIKYSSYFDEQTFEERLGDMIKNIEENEK